jgi:alkanesulfonate monooxygenase SsuD/methylene tetrahydromethanopterin reductase-like flavin-dependent oxidoreductase (luciferase family)
MKIGLALPANVPGVIPSELIDWARRCDAAPFSSLAANDRLAYVTGDPLALLAMACGVTSRVRLMTSILIAPVRNAGVLATQAATIDSLSNGRLTLGLAVGGREDDFVVGQALFHNRGKRFDEMLSHMRRVWEGDTFMNDSHPSGPTPVQQGGPEILLGGSSPAAIARVGRWANGEESVIEQARANQYDYYSWLGEKTATGRAQGIVTTPEAMRETLAGLESIGVDEVIMQPTHAAPEQLDRAVAAVF